MRDALLFLANALSGFAALSFLFLHIGGVVIWQLGGCWIGGPAIFLPLLTPLVACIIVGIKVSFSRRTALGAT